MKWIVAATFAGILLPSAGPSHAGDWRRERAIQTYGALLRGERSFAALTPPEREDIRLLQAELRGSAILPAETRQACLERVLTASPTALERAIADLKCSQRP